MTSNVGTGSTPRDRMKGGFGLPVRYALDMDDIWVCAGCEKTFRGGESYQRPGARTYNFCSPAHAADWHQRQH